MEWMTKFGLSVVRTTCIFRWSLGSREESSSSSYQTSSEENLARPTKGTSHSCALSLPRRKTTEGKGRRVSLLSYSVVIWVHRHTLPFFLSLQFYLTSHSLTLSLCVSVCACVCACVHEGECFLESIHLWSDMHWGNCAFFWGNVLVSCTKRENIFPSSSLW